MLDYPSCQARLWKRLVFCGLVTGELKCSVRGAEGLQEMHQVEREVQHKLDQDLCSSSIK